MECNPFVLSTFWNEILLLVIQLKTFSCSWCSKYNSIVCIYTPRILIFAWTPCIIIRFNIWLRFHFFLLRAFILYAHFFLNRIYCILFAFSKFYRCWYHYSNCSKHPIHKLSVKNFLKFFKHFWKFIKYCTYNSNSLYLIQST